MDGLQFQKAEFASNRPACAICKSAIERTYFHLNGHTICAACAEKTHAGQRRPSNTWVLRGLLYGAGMAVVCAVGYAIFTLVTHIEFALISIAVGYLIGRAVRYGSQGLGGRRCQIVAVLLTYFAITVSYTPLIVKGMREGAKRQADSAKAPETGKSAQPLTPVPGAANATSGVSVQPRSPGALLILLGLGVIITLAIAAPFLALSSGVGAIISLLIIFFGLQQAWRQTARDSRLLMGPYELEETTPVA